MEFVQIKDRVDAFIEDLIGVYRKYGLSLAHEDTQGAFVVEDFSEVNCEWLRQALCETKEEPQSVVIHVEFIPPSTLEQD